MQDSVRTHDGLEGVDVATAPRPVGGRHVLSMCQGLGGQSLALVVSVGSLLH